MPAPPNVTVPPRQQASGSRPRASANEIGVRNDLRQFGAVSRQKIGMTIGDMAFALWSQFDVDA
jgi:hypothetical protein